jgi:GT2 family glycosyltransferase
VAVCTYNGSRTIRDCLEGCARLDYPDYEVIVVDDGSTDGTADIVGEFDVRLVQTPNAGLSHARNVAMRAATGQIIAYLDDDARPDQHWLNYLARTFLTTEHAGVGGPNIVPEDDPPRAQCVANAPGGPTHVLLDDRVAEHIPGCNMAFRLTALREITGFDPQFRIAGDDVDVCWRIQAQGGTLGFNPGAVVWHHRRNTINAYWKQQLNYGRAEAMLEKKWPAKFNGVGQVGWKGRLYGTGTCRGIALWPCRIYHGVWGSEAYQSLRRSDSAIVMLPLTPEWYLLIAALGALSALGVAWHPLLLVAPPLLIAAGAASIAQAARGAANARFPRASAAVSRRRRLGQYGYTTALHLIQPAARLWGRLSCGLTPWRRQMQPGLYLPLPRTALIWSESWQAPEQRLGAVEAMLQARGAYVRRGGECDQWDLEVRGGCFASVRCCMAIEQYSGGRQQLRFRLWPRLFMPGVLATALFGGVACCAAIGNAPLALAALGTVATLMILRALGDCGAATSCLNSTLTGYRAQVEGIASDPAAMSVGTKATPARLMGATPSSDHGWSAPALTGGNPLSAFTDVTARLALRDVTRKESANVSTRQIPSLDPLTRPSRVYPGGDPGSRRHHRCPDWPLVADALEGTRTGQANQVPVEPPNARPGDDPVREQLPGLATEQQPCQ